MAIQFYIQIKGKETGPLSSGELMLLAQLGALLPTDLVRKDGSEKWVQANRIKKLEFSSPQDEPKEEIEEVLVVDPEPIPPPGHLSSPITPVSPFGQSNWSNTGNSSGQSTDSPAVSNNNLPHPPDHGFVEQVITVCNTMGVVTLIGSVIAVVFVGTMNSEILKEKAGILIGLMVGTLILGVLTSITMFAMAQLLTMAIYGSINLHYIMHSNLVAMRIMVNQVTKKE